MLAIKELLGFAKSNGDTLESLRADVTALKEAVGGVTTAAAGHAKELEGLLAIETAARSAAETELAKVKAELATANAEVEKIKGSIADFNGKVEAAASAKAAEIVAKLGHTPLAIGASEDPAAGKQIEPEVKGLDRTKRAFEKQQKKP